MKSIYKLILVSLLAIPLMLNAQKTYVSTMKFTFSGGSEFGSPIGNDCGNNDITKTVNSIDGIMQLDVNKVCHSWSFLQHWMGNPYAQSIVFKKRYMEIRVKSTAAHATGLSVGFQVSGGNPDGCIGKSIPGLSYKIFNPDVWEIKFWQVGGNCDTVFKEVDWFFENGTYYIDYALLGDAAEPPVPTIDVVKSKIVKDNAGVQNISLTNVAIPNRDVQDGLTVEATSAKDGILQNVQLVDLGDGSFVDVSTKTATLQFSPVAGMGGQNDSIIVLVKDTIRGGVKRMAFLVDLLAGGDLADLSAQIAVYPSVITDVVTIALPEAITGDIAVVDMVGKVVVAEKIVAKNNVKLDLSALAKGVYIVKISDGTSVATKKIVKE